MLSLNSCFKAQKYSVKHPKKYNSITTYFVENGGCIAPILTHTDTIKGKDSISYIDSSNIKGKDSLIFVNKIKIRDNIIYKQSYIEKNYEDSSKIQSYRNKLNEKETILKSLTSENEYCLNK